MPLCCLAHGVTLTQRAWPWPGEAGPPTGHVVPQPFCSGSRPVARLDSRGRRFPLRENQMLLLVENQLQAVLSGAQPTASFPKSGWGPASHHVPVLQTGLLPALRCLQCCSGFGIGKQVLLSWAVRSQTPALHPLSSLPPTMGRVGPLPPGPRGGAPAPSSRLPRRHSGRGREGGAGEAERGRRKEGKAGGLQGIK